MKSTKKGVFTAACIALCVVLPMIFHSIPNAGNVILPMHIPVMICGLICGMEYGLFCGLLGPFISGILTQMPPMAALPAMMAELAVYGLLTGLIYSIIHTGKLIPDIILSLAVSMAGGRIVYGIINALIFRAGNYSVETWLVSSFVTALPGIIIEFVLIPAVIMALEKSSLIPVRYEQ